MSPILLYILGITLLSTIIAWFVSQSKAVEKPVKVMLFVLYFWGSVFIQLMLFAVLYKFGIISL
jgi:hypothetical protein